VAGSNPWITVSVNGERLGPEHLRNKPNDFKLAGGRDLTWYRNGAWRVVYAPEFDAALKDAGPNAIKASDDPYRYVWDITRLVEPGRNRLRIEHLQFLAKPDTLILRKIEVQVAKRSEHGDIRAGVSAPTGALPIYTARATESIPVTALLGDRGAIDLRAGGVPYRIRTRVSLPEGKWLEAHDRERMIALEDGRSGSVSWSAGSVEIHRRLSVERDHLKVQDVFRNTGRELVGVIIEHHASGDGPPRNVYLSGVPKSSPSGTVREPANPTSFARWGGGGLGLVAEDDIFRVHVRSFALPRSIGIADDFLGLEPSASVVLDWSLYPVRSGDYWDFINAVRRNWNSNFTIQGGFVFAELPRDKPSEWYRTWLRSRGVRFVVVGVARQQPRVDDQSEGGRPRRCRPGVLPRTDFDRAERGREIP
jgi:hypothetical protein